MVRKAFRFSNNLFLNGKEENGDYKKIKHGGLRVEL